MNKKAKYSGQVKKYFFDLLGPAKSKAVLSYFYRKKYKKNHFNFPINATSIKNVLIILPEADIEILYQLKNLLTIISKFKDANVTVFCENSSSSFAKMIPNVTIIEYSKSQFVVDSIIYAQEFRNNYDLCILLNKEPEVSMLSLIGATNAPIRAGYEGAGEYPFLNLKARSSAIRRYISDKNCMIAELFGEHSEPLRISVAKKTLEEVDYTLKNANLLHDEGLIGIDALFFLRQFGEKWFDNLLQSINHSYNGKAYFYVPEIPATQELTYLKTQCIPIINECSPFKIAALIYRSSLIVTGNTMFYGIAAVLNFPAFGFFKESEYDMYCPKTHSLKGIVYHDFPDDESIAALIHSFKTISKKKNKIHS